MLLHSSANYFLLCNQAEGFRKKLTNIVVVCILLLIYNITFIHYFDTLFRFGQLSTPDQFPFLLGKKLDPLSLRESVLRLGVVAPIWETLAWIYAPALLARGFGDKKFMLPVMIISSIMFGWGHNGAEGVFLQGVTGFFFFAVFLKNNYSIFSAMVTHSLFNLSILFFL